jgi:flagellar motility protein MotE (MotC chaperone)
MALLLIVSGALRLGDQVGSAAAATSVASADPIVERTDRILGMPLDTQTLPQLLEAFKAREASLLEAERKAAEREAALAASAESIAAQLDELIIAEERLAATLAKTDVAAEEDLARLATVYENMKPRDTAALFSEMAPGFAAGFLGLMRPEAAAAIMTELEPNTAHLISVMLAGRNATAPSRQ